MNHQFGDLCLPLDANEILSSQSTWAILWYDARHLLFISVTCIAFENSNSWACLIQDKNWDPRRRTRRLGQYMVSVLVLQHPCSHPHSIHERLWDLSWAIVPPDFRCFQQRWAQQETREGWMDISSFHSHFPARSFQMAIYLSRSVLHPGKHYISCCGLRVVNPPRYYTFSSFLTLCLCNPFNNFSSNNLSMVLI